MKILVIGGMHGNEPLGPRIVSWLNEHHMEGVDGVIANGLAYKANTRFVKQDMNRSFPGIKDSSDYEHRRPYELIEMAKKYDLVFDFHNTNCPDNDCVFVGEDSKDYLYNIAGHLKMSRVVVADYDCMNKYVPNCISVEVSLQSELNKPKLWIAKIAELSRLQAKDIDPAVDLELYKFAYRMTLEDRDRYGLESEGLKAFVPLNSELAEKMNLKSPAYPIFINDAYTPYNYGGILSKITKA